ncbi:MULTISPECIES: hypothetical protein [Myroides]|nr:hypothetical protein [Myroides marinus]
MDKVVAIKVIKDLVDSKSLVKSYIRGEVSKEELQTKGVRLVKPF